jgi:hypothetical protein
VAQVDLPEQAQVGCESVDSEVHVPRVTSSSPIGPSCQGTRGKHYFPFLK